MIKEIRDFAGYLFIMFGALLVTREFLRAHLYWMITKLNAENRQIVAELLEEFNNSQMEPKV